MSTGAIDSQKIMKQHSPQLHCELPQVTRQRLLHFGRRSAQVAFWRGAAITTCLAILALLVGVVMDSMTVVPSIRWIVSSLFYIVATAGIAYLCVRPLAARSNLLRTAADFETREVRLKEMLLSAVELSGDGRQGESLAFRQHAQSRVAEIISQSDVPRLLPWRDIRSSLIAGLLALAVLLGLCLMPGLHMPLRMSRVLFPASDLARVGDTVIQLEQPNPASTRVPQDDVVAIVARLEGPKPKDVILEIRTPDSQRQQVMQPLQSDAARGSSPDAKSTSESDSQPEAARFEGLLTASDAWIEYRVRAGSAHTAWNRLTTGPRPTVYQFHKSIASPAYAQVPSIDLVEQHGDIRGLQGSRVTLEIAVDVPLTEAHIQWLAEPPSETGLEMTEQHTTPMKLTTPRSAKLEFELEADSQYRVMLVAAETGFTNAFSPSYRIAAIPDQAPKLAWIRPLASSVIVDRQQLLDLGIRVTDELPIASLKQKLRREPSDQLPSESRTQANYVAEELDNSSVGWEVTPLPVPSTTDDAKLQERDGTDPVKSRQLNPSQWSPAFGIAGQEVAWNLDLLPKQLATGDAIQLQVVAEDRYGATVESSVVRMVIAATSIDIEPSPSDLLRGEMAEQLASLAKAVTRAEDPQSLEQGGPRREQLTRLREAMEQDRTRPPNAEQLALLAETTQTLSQELGKQMQTLAAKAEQALAANADIVDSGEMRDTTALLSKLNEEALPAIAQEVQQLMRDVNLPADESQAVQEQNERARQTTASIERALRTVGELSVGFRAMAAHDEITRRAAQFDALAVAQRALQTSLDRGDLPAAQARRQQLVIAGQLRELQTDLVSTKNAPPATLDRLRQVAEEMNWFVDRAEQVEDQESLQEIRGAAEQVTNGLNQLQVLQRLDGGAINAANNARKRARDQSGPAADAIGVLAENISRGTANPAQFERTGQQLSLRRTLHRTGRSGDLEFASDLGNARRAIAAIASQDSPDRNLQLTQLRSLQSAISQLSAIRAVRDSQSLLGELLSGESHALDGLSARTEQPRNWETLQVALERASQELRRSNLEGIAERVDRMRWEESTGRAGEKISKRLWDSAAPISAVSELQSLGSELQQIETALAEHADAARAELLALAPTVGQLARTAAEATEAVEQQTEQLARDTRNDQVPDPEARLRSLETELNAALPAVEELREALVDTADRQDLLEERELQLARQADAAIALVDRIEQQNSTSLPDEAEQLQATAAEQARNLEQASDMQSDSAEALSQLADNFDALESLSNEAYSAEQAALRLAELKAIEASLDAVPDGDSQPYDGTPYDQAEQLVRINEAGPEQVLQQLERELETNPPMRSEMSDIARHATEQALDGLELASDEQKTLRPELEDSDPVMRAQKELLFGDVDRARLKAQQAVKAVLAQAGSTAGDAREAESERQLQQLSERLDSAVQALEQINPRTPFDTMREAVGEFAATLEDTQKALTERGDELDKAKNNEIHSNEVELNRSRRKMQDLQRQNQQKSQRTAEQLRRVLEQNVKSTENVLRGAERQTQSHMQNLDKMKKQLEQQPEQDNLKQQIAEQEQRVAQAEADQAASELVAEAMQQRFDRESLEVTQINARKLIELDTNNPAAALSADLATQAAQQSRKIAGDLETWNQGSPAQTRASGSRLEEATKRQNKIGQEVHSASADLARAARHEARLNHQPNHKALQQLSYSVQDVRDQQIAEAAQELTSAAIDAQREDMPTRQASTQKSQAASRAIAQTESAISASAESVRDFLDQSQAAGGVSENGVSESNASQPAAQASARASEQAQANAPSESASGSPQSLGRPQNPSSSPNSSSSPNPSATQNSSGPQGSGGSPLSPQQMARLLDELDRQLNAQQSLGQQDNNKNQSGRDATGQAVPQTLARAARALADRLSQQRQPPSTQASADVGMATEGLAATASPQGPTTVRLLDTDAMGSDEINGDWGSLREQSAAEMIQTRRDPLSPQVRRQVDAYFRALSQRGQLSEDKEKQP